MRSPLQFGAAKAMILTLALLCSMPAFGSGLRRVIVNGRAVYVNDEEEKATTASHRASRGAKVSENARKGRGRESAKAEAKPDYYELTPGQSLHYYEYYSVERKRWVRLTQPTPVVLERARSAASEVNGYIERQPKTPPAGEGRKNQELSNPNYRRAAAGRMVTSRELDSVIAEAARRHGVDANLVRSLIQVESGGNARARSPKGAMGLMQLMPATARSLGVDNPFDPQQNVDAGVRHLKGLLQNYNGDVRLSLAAYNAGSGAVARYGNVVPPYRETQQYVARITSLYGRGPSSAVAAPRAPSAPPARLARDGRGILTLSNND